MCQEKCEKGKNPKECTAEQIKECHPDTEDKHPCEDVKDKTREKPTSNS